MKKNICKLVTGFIIVFVIVIISMICSKVKVDASTNEYCYENKITYGDGYTYDLFLDKLDDNSNVNVLIKFHSMQAMFEFEKRYATINIYCTPYSPYSSMIIYSKEEFIQINNDLLMCLIDNNYIDYIYCFDVDVSVESSNDVIEVNDYEWNEVLKDIGFVDIDDECFDSIRIGILDEGVINTENDYFKDMNIETYSFENQELIKLVHTNTTCCIINEITKNIDTKYYYSAQVDIKNFSKSILEMLKWFVLNEVQVVNISWGFSPGYSDTYKKLDELFDYYAENYNIIFIKSTGNYAMSAITSPGYSKNIITVGAVDSNRELLSTSNYSENYYKPLIVAPGGKICEINSHALNCGAIDKYSTGTSFSTAIVTGIVSLLYLEFEEEFSNLENVVGVLAAGSLKLDNENEVYEKGSGFGLVNYYNTRQILKNKDYYYSNNGNIQNINLKPYTSCDLIFTTKGYCLENIKNEIEQNYNGIGQNLNKIFEEGEERIYVPTITAIIENNQSHEVLYEFKNDDNIFYIRLENMSSEEMVYSIIIDYEDDLIKPISVSLRKYDEYEHFETTTNHGWKSENDIIKHTLIENSNGYYCEECEYVKAYDSNIVTDPNENMVCGTEVTLNNGEYGGYEITQGFTRILYLQGNDMLSLSRLDYNWTSSDESVAIVSSYGTVTALSVSVPTWVTITATYKYNDENTEIIFHKDLLIKPDISEEFKIYTYDVTMGVNDSYVFKMSYDKSPTISMFDYVWKIPCQKDESAGVKISQWGTITALAPGEMFIEGWSKYNPYIVIQINVVVI